MTNPWSREHFDLDGQKEIVQNGDCKEINGLLIDAGWPPEAAHSFIMHMEHARAVSERIEEIEHRSESEDSYSKRMEHIRHNHNVSADTPPFMTSRVFNVTVALIVFVLGVWLTA